MVLCPAGHQSSTTDYCSICGTPMGGAEGSAPVAPVETGGVERNASGEPDESSAIRRPTQTCPVCSSVASRDAFFCESCGYDFLTGSMPRSVGSVEPVESEEPSEPGGTPVEQVESSAAEMRDSAETSQESVGTPEAVETPVEPVDDPEAIGASAEPAGTISAQPDGPGGTSVEPVETTSPEPPEPALPPVTTFELDDLPKHGPLDNPLVVESQPRAVPAPESSASPQAGPLSLGDAGRDLPNPDDLEPLALPHGPTPQPLPGHSSAPRPDQPVAPQRSRPGSPPPPDPRVQANRVPSQAPRPRAVPPHAARVGPPRQPGLPPQPGAAPQQGQRQQPEVQHPVVQPPRPLNVGPQRPPDAVRAPQAATSGARSSPSTPPQPEPPAQSGARPSTGPVLPSASGPARWVAEIWIDPEWYRVQQAPEQLPSPGQPLIQSLRKQSIVIGRTTSSGRPDLDCVTDTGVSRRQAVLTTDGIRWFVEDLGSANGTYIGQVDQPMPTTPIKGRVELGHHDRLYVGSWTRIVVRPALVQEADL